MLHPSHLDSCVHNPLVVDAKEVAAAKSARLVHLFPPLSHLLAHSLAHILE